MTAAERSARAAAADSLCEQAWASVDGPDSGAALVAVGGYGRGELAPYSDLDVVLVYDALPDADLERIGSGVWYPLWDSGTPLDHSVRTLEETTRAAADDLKVAMGLLNVRHVAGDPNLTLRLRTAMLTAWRRTARERLPALHQMVAARHELMGELAHVSVPDLKEAEGGLRDATVLNALVATWLVDVPHVELEGTRMALLDVRDLVHEVAGRGTDRVAPEMWGELARLLELTDETDAQRHVRELGRRITHLSRLVWRRVDDVLARKASAAAPRRPSLATVAAGVAVAAGEVVLDRSARPADDPVLVLRAAAAAAERDILLAPPTAARLARDCPPMPTPWPAEARDLLVRLLASGRGLLQTWETLEETGAVQTFLPEWDRIRLLPHATPIHRFTVDRHCIETCIEAAGMIRRVDRPDVLMVAALLHDIGKGGDGEHSIAGEPIARGIAERMGFESTAVDLIGDLVRHHLLLSETATTRDPEDPATVETILTHVRTPQMLELLASLTEADCLAASPKAWSSWRANLIRGLARRTASALVSTTDAAPDVGLEPVDIPEVARLGQIAITLESGVDGTRVTTICHNRNGLLADLSGVFALERLRIRAARAWPQGDFGIATFELADRDVDAGRLRQTFAAVTEGRLDPRTRFRDHVPRAGALPPTVELRPEASTDSTVLEVRTDDRLGVLYLVGTTLAALGIAVRSAHVDTVGPQAVDVFYVQEVPSGPLSEPRAAAAADAVRAALTSSGSVGER